MSGSRLLLFQVLAVSFAVSAHAVDVAQCGQVVPAREHGVLLGDLDCSGQAPGTHAIVLGRRSSLDLQGHTVVGPPPGYASAAVHCEFGDVRVRYTAQGPVHIPPTGSCEVFSTGASASLHGELGISTDKSVTVRNVDIVPSWRGIYASRRSGTISATDVTVTGGSEAGLDGSRLLLENVSVTNTGSVGIDATFGGVRGSGITLSDNAGGGMRLNGKVKVVGLHCTGNGGPGVRSGRMSLVDSVVTGNTADGQPVDLLSSFRPQVVNTVCGSSAQLAVAPPASWEVCADD